MGCLQLSSRRMVRSRLRIFLVRRRVSSFELSIMACRLIFGCLGIDDVSIEEAGAIEDRGYSSRSKRSCIEESTKGKSSSWCTSRNNLPLHL